jgi:hypothetical protein
MKLGGEGILAERADVDVLGLDQHEHGVVWTKAIETGRLLGRVIGIATYSDLEGVDLSLGDHTRIELLQLDLEAAAHVVEVGEGHDGIAKKSRLLHLKHLQVLGLVEVVETLGLGRTGLLEESINIAQRRIRDADLLLLLITSRIGLLALAVGRHGSCVIIFFFSFSI